MPIRYLLPLLLLSICLQPRFAKAQASNPQDPSSAEAPQQRRPEVEVSGTGTGSQAVQTTDTDTTGTVYIGDWSPRWTMVDAAQSPLFDIALEDGVYSLEHEFTYESLVDEEMSTGLGRLDRQEVEYQLGTLASRPLVVRINAPFGASIGDEPGVIRSLGTLAQKVEQKVGAPVELCKGLRECVETCTRQTEGCCKWRCKK